MCTIVVFSRIRPEADLVVLANRDEFYARDAAPPRLLDPDTGAVGGLDAVGGGTWMGATPSGFFVGLTNQRTWQMPARARKSRGQVALDALRRGSRDEVTAFLGGLDPSDYNPFNLIYGDPSGLSVAYARASGIEHHALPPGLWVLTNDRIGSPDFPKAERARVLAEGLDENVTAPEGVVHAQRILADHLTPPRAALPVPPEGSPLTVDFIEALQAICIHTPTYGTRSSTTIVANDDGLVDYRFANGPPCEAPLKSIVHLFDEPMG